MFCPTCATLLPDDSHVNTCPVCGEQLEAWRTDRTAKQLDDQPLYCVACGSWLRYDVSHCPACGHGVGLHAPVAETPRRQVAVTSRPLVSSSPAGTGWSNKGPTTIQPNTATSAVDPTEGRHASRPMAAALGVVVGMLIAALAFFVVLPLVGQQGMTGEQGAAQSQGDGSVDPDDDELTQNQDGDEPTSGQDDDGNDVVESSVYGEPGNQDVISTDTANMLVNADADFRTAFHFAVYPMCRENFFGECQSHNLQFLPFISIYISILHQKRNPVK